MSEKDVIAGDLDGDNCAKLRLVLVAEYYDSGGTRTYLKQLLDFYALHRVWVCLVGLQAKPDIEIQELLSEYGFDYVGYSAITKRRARSTDSSRPPVWWAPSIYRERRAFTRFLRRIRAESIVVSVGTPGQFLGAVGAADGIYILHTYPHGRRQQFLARWLLAPFTRRVTKFVAVSNYERLAMGKLWRIRDFEKTIAVIPNTAGPVRDDASPATSTPPRVLTASWVESYKEPLDWIEIAKGVSERLGRESVQFVWFGEGSLLEGCKLATKRVHAAADVRFAGHVAELEREYQKSTLYLQTSSTENMSLSVIDALRFGVPAVATTVGALPEIVDDQVTGVLVPVHDVSATVEAIVQLLQNSEAREAMSKASRRRYADHFSESIWYRRLDEVHGEALGLWTAKGETI